MACQASRPRGSPARCCFPAVTSRTISIIAQSLWRDGDLKIENNHERRDYQRVLPARPRAPLPDARQGRRDLFDPSRRHAGADGAGLRCGRLSRGRRGVCTAGGHRGAALMWHRCGAIERGCRRRRRSHGRRSSLTAPFLFNSFAIYPEILAALAVVIGVHALRPDCSGIVLPFGFARRPRVRGAALAQHEVRADVRRPRGRGARPRSWWPSSRAEAASGRRCRSGRAAAPCRSRIAALPVPACLARRLVLFLLRDLGLAVAAGALWRAGADGALQPHVRRARVVLRSGVRAAAVRAGVRPGRHRPVGDVAERRRRRAVMAIEIAVVFARHCSARWVRSASGGAARRRPAGRSTSGLWLLALPMAIAFRAAPAGQRPARRAASAAVAEHRHRRLSCWSLSRAFSSPTAATARRACSSTFRRGGRRGPLAPSFIYHEPLTALAHTLAWLALAAIAAAVISFASRARHARHRRRSLRHRRRVSGAWRRGRHRAACCRPRQPWPAVDVARTARTAAARRVRSRRAAGRHRIQPIAFIVRATSSCSPRRSKWPPGSRARAAADARAAQRPRLAAGGTLPSRGRVERRAARREDRSADRTDR